MGYIYLFEATTDYEQQYKIGFTKNKRSKDVRLSAIKTGNPGDVKCIEFIKTKHNRKVETSMHNHFKSKQINREWFDLDFEDVKNFRNLCEKIEKNYDVLKESENPFI